MKSPIRALSLAVGFAALPLSGCELLQGLYQQDLEIPIPLETPAAELDATAQVESAESSLCSDPDSRNCLVVKALDYSDDQNVGDPPTIPDEFPVEVTVMDPATQMEETINAEDWAKEAGLSEGMDLAQAIPVDLTEAVGVETPDAVKAVTFKNVKLNWQENSFTFDTVPFDLYVSSEAIDDLSDAQALIDAGTVQKVGTIPVQPAATTGEADVTFEEGGEERFSDALKALTFTVVVALPPNTEVTLNDGTDLPDGTATKKKPLGFAKVSMKADLVYTVSAADVVGQVQDATQQ